MLENAITTITKNMQYLLGQNIGEKVFNLKIQILLLDLELQVCGIFLLITRSTAWIYLKIVVSRCQRIIQFGLGAVRLYERKWCHYPRKLIDYHRGGGLLTWTSGCFQENRWDIYTHDYFVRFCKITAFIPY